MRIYMGRGRPSTSALCRGARGVGCRRVGGVRGGGLGRGGIRGRSMLGMYMRRVVLVVEVEVEVGGRGGEMLDVIL